MKISESVTAKIASVKATRADTVSQLTNGDLGFEELVSKAQQDPEVGAVRLIAAIVALPGASKVATRRFLDEHQISDRLSLAEVSNTQLDLVRGFING